MNVVEGISSFQALVSRVVHDGGGQRVKAQEVCHLSRGTLQGTSDITTCQAGIKPGQSLRGALLVGVKAAGRLRAQDGGTILQ